MSLCLTLITGSVWLLLLRSEVRTPVRNWMLLFFVGQTVWQASETIHYSIHPDYNGSLAYKLLVSAWDLPALALLEVAYIQVNYLFVQDTYPRERRLVFPISAIAAVLFCGFITWNEFGNNSNIEVLNTAGFLFGSLYNGWALLICLRKSIYFSRQKHPDAQGARGLAYVNIIFVVMCLTVVVFGFYSTVGYWTYCSLLWSGNLLQIVVYLNFTAVPISLQTKYIGFAQVVVASILLTVMLAFCPPVDITDIALRLTQQNSLLKITILILGTATLNVLFLPYLIKKTLTDPVQRLLAGMQHVNEGDLSIQVAETTQDEVGTLTRQFNQMTRSLHTARAGLTHYAQTLEEQVADRTAELQADKARIEEQSRQLQTIMRELHHRVKNNLAIVSGLLSLQLNRLEDQQAVKAFQEGQRRIEAIALIHQRLYQSQELTAINMRQFVEELTLNTMLAYGYQPESVQLTIDTDVQILDIDLAIPLSLIINELLTNCFKYAIPYTARPRLSISLLNRNGLLLELADNGPGIDLTAWQHPSSSFGKRLIKGLSEQAGGHLTVENLGLRTTWSVNGITAEAANPEESVLVATRNGTLFRLFIPAPKLIR